MFRLNYLKRCLAIAAPILALALMSGDLAVAQKKKGGGGGSGGTGGGTIYFDSYTLGGFHQMNSDGSGKTLLPIPAGEPSNHLHNGHRWFLALEYIEGETNPGGVYYRSELFAYRDDGVRLQLTDDPDLEAAIGTYLFDTVRWQPGDARISWIAQYWVDGQVVESGIYEAELVYDEFGDLVGLDVDTSSLLVPEIGIGTHDWSPDGTRIVYDVINEFGAGELYIANLLQGQISLLTTSPGKLPDWSPDGSQIAFQKAVYRGGISTINPDGTGLAEIIRPTGRSISPQIYRPRWSPTGSHLIYAQWSADSSWSAWQYVYRATANGASKSNLTSNTDFSTPVGWR